MRKIGERILVSLSRRLEFFSRVFIFRTKTGLSLKRSQILEHQFAGLLTFLRSHSIKTRFDLVYTAMLNKSVKRVRKSKQFCTRRMSYMHCFVCAQNILKEFLCPSSNSENKRVYLVIENASVFQVAYRISPVIVHSLFFICYTLDVILTHFRQYCRIFICFFTLPLLFSNIYVVQPWPIF